MAVAQPVGSEIAGNLDQIADLLDSPQAAKFTYDQLHGTLDTFNQWFVRISELRRTVIAMMAVTEHYGGRGLQPESPGELKRVVKLATERAAPPCDQIQPE